MTPRPLTLGCRGVNSRRGSLSFTVCLVAGGGAHSPQTTAPPPTLTGRAGEEASVGPQVGATSSRGDQGSDTGSGGRMSETEPEQTPDEAEPTEPESEQEAEPETEDEGAEETPSDPAVEQVENETDADIEAIYAKLGTKAKNYTKGLAELLEGTGVPVAPCEMCSDAFPGVRWLTPSDETHAMLLAVVGAAGGDSPLTEDPDALLCDRCQGWGAVKLPSHVPGNEQRTCRKCNGAGYLDPNPQSGALQPPEPVAPNGPAEPLPGVPENDPSVVDLRARGYTIIPPMQIGAISE